jgi:hypothetical protein
MSISDVNCSLNKTYINQHYINYYWRHNDFELTSNGVISSLKLMNLI